MVDVLFYIALIFLVLVIGFVFYKKKKKKKVGLDQTDKPPEDIYPLY